MKSLEIDNRKMVSFLMANDQESNLKEQGWQLRKPRKNIRPKRESMQLETR